jgi:peptidoglycan/xylan/chitin deacetylase (PgdA/CDA1 family)
VLIHRSHVVALVVLAALLVAGCGQTPKPAAPTVHARNAIPGPPPDVTLTGQDRAVWQRAPKAHDRIPVLLYHGVDVRGGFANQADAFYGVAPANFAKQMALLDHAGYRAITLEQFTRALAGKRVVLPPRPILITFDDARADSWLNSDLVLARYGWSAVMFVDVGAVARRDAEYLSWDQLAAMEQSGRWSLQLHAGRGHHNIRYGSGPRDVGPFYAYRDALGGETLAGWQRRVAADLAWGVRELRAHLPGYQPLAFAPPFGAYGQLGTNDPQIPRLLSRELRDHFGLVFVQQDPHPARPGERVVTRMQLNRTVTGGELHYWLDSA